MKKLWGKIQAYFKVKGGRQRITEEMGIHNEWYKQAKEMTPKELPHFINHLINNYEHDYGTIVHAISAGMVATAWAIDRGPSGGITGFQAGCINWQILEHWGGIKAPARILEIKDMLYPQMCNKFTTISSETWDWLQKEAASRIKESPNAHPDVMKHWKSIVLGQIPFGYKAVNNER